MVGHIHGRRDGRRNDRLQNSKESKMKSQRDSRMTQGLTQAKGWAQIEPYQDEKSFCATSLLTLRLTFV